MNRRDFIKKGLLAAGAASLVLLEGLAAFTPETAPEGAFHPAKGPTNAPQDGRISPPEAEATVPAETSPAGEKSNSGECWPEIPEVDDVGHDRDERKQRPRKMRSP